MIVHEFIEKSKELIGEKAQRLEPLVQEAINRCISFYSEEEALVVLDGEGVIVGYNDLFLEWSRIDPKGKNLFDFADASLQGLLQEQFAHGSIDRTKATFLFNEPLDVEIKVERFYFGDKDYRLLFLKKRAFNSVHYQFEELQRKSAELVLRIKDFEPLLSELLKLFTASPLFDFALVAKIDMKMKKVLPKLSSGDSELVSVMMHRQYDFDYFATLLEVLIKGEDFVAKDVEIEGRSYKKQIILPLFDKWEQEKSDEISYLVLIFAKEEFEFDSYSKRMLREIIYKINVALADIVLKEKARMIVSTDPLTALPKREYLFKELQCCMDDGIPFAIAIVDIDKLQKVNDVLGFWAGDKAIKALAEHLRQIDVLSVRYGSDEFALLIKGEKSYIYQILDQVLQFNQKLISINGSEVFLPVSMGVSFYPEDGRTQEELLLMAENALKEAKKRGGKTIVYADKERTMLPKDYLALEKELKEALERGEYEMYFQPIVDIHEKRIWGCEALLRWRSKRRGIVSPGLFIPILEQSGLINDVGDEIVAQVVKALKEFERFDIHISFSMNISVMQFLVGNVAKKIISTIHKCSAKASNLIVEVTESVLMENIDAVKHQIELLQEEGVGIEIDDFGTGYSSLAYLKTLPISALKIDRAFIKELAYNKEDTSIVRAIVSIAKALGKEVIAEGVEDYKTLCRLKELGIDYVQGFYFAKPMPKEELRRFVEEFDYSAFER